MEEGLILLLVPLGMTFVLILMVALVAGPDIFLGGILKWRNSIRAFRKAWKEKDENLTK